MQKCCIEIIIVYILFENAIWSTGKFEVKSWIADKWAFRWRFVVLKLARNSLRVRSQILSDHSGITIQWNQTTRTSKTGQFNHHWRNERNSCIRNENLDARLMGKEISSKWYQLIKVCTNVKLIVEDIKQMKSNEAVHSISVFAF